jgi:hypothetical protein
MNDCDLVPDLMTTSRRLDFEDGDEVCCCCWSDNV